MDELGGVLNPGTAGSLTLADLCDAMAEIEEQDGDLLAAARWRRSAERERQRRGKKNSGIPPPLCCWWA